VTRLTRVAQKSVNSSVKIHYNTLSVFRPPVHTASASVIQSSTAAPDEPPCSVTLRTTLRQNMRTSGTAGFLRWSPSEAVPTVSSVNTRHSSKNLIVIKTRYGNKTVHVLILYIYM
jgi:hypothetical protein